MYDELSEFDYIGDDPFGEMDYYDRYDDWSGSKLPKSVFASVADYAESY